MSPSRFTAALAAFLLVAPPLAAQAADPVREELVVDTGTAEHSFEVEIADDPQERARGLMFRREMAAEHGMLFDFGEEQQASFWMENTHIPLDMIFINDDGTVDSIAERTTPLSRRSVVSDGPVRYVLEINGGLSDELGIGPGDTVSGPAIEARQ
jgi:uncharacterized membrane protein (UPF0127 family)